MARSVKSEAKGALKGVASSKFEELHPRGPNGEFIEVPDRLLAIGAVPNEGKGTWLVPHERREQFMELMKEINFTVTLVPEGMRPATDEERIKFKVAPAWRNVLINTDPKADLLVTGVDGKGKLQYTYSDRYWFHQGRKKFKRVAMLQERLPTILDTAMREQGNGLEVGKAAKAADDAAVMHLIAKMGLRPGSTADTKAKVQAYGATTLERRHVKVTGSKVRLDFIGKKGVHIKLDVDDPDLARMFKQRIEGKSGRDRLFPNTSDRRLRAWCDRVAPGHTPKDFRTHLATTTAMQLVSELPVPTNQADFKRQRYFVGDQVSALLGNDRDEAIKSYIDPTVFRSWESADTVTKDYAKKQIVHLDTVEERLTEVMRYGLEDWPEKGSVAKTILGNAHDTRELHTRTVGDRVQYTPERKTLHDRIIGGALAPSLRSALGEHPAIDKLERGEALTPDEVADVRARVIAGRGGGKPKALFLAGGPASGKTSALKASPELSPEHAVTLNPDDFKEQLPEYLRMVKGGDKYAANGSHEESSDLGRRATAEAKALGLNVVVDGTGDSNVGKFPLKVRAMIDDGYDVDALYVTIPTDEAVVRGTLRAMGSGRWVPTPELRKQHKNVSTNFLGVSDMGAVGNVKVYDNDRTDENGRPLLIAEGRHGRLVVLDQGAYDEFVGKMNE